MARSWIITKHKFMYIYWILENLLLFRAYSPSHTQQYNENHLQWLDTSDRGFRDDPDRNVDTGPRMFCA